MLDFDTYVARHGEFGVQALVERLERYAGVRPSIAVTLEDRWMAVMSDTDARACAAQPMAA